MKPIGKKSANGYKAASQLVTSSTRHTVNSSQSSRHTVNLSQGQLVTIHHITESDF